MFEREAYANDEEFQFLLVRLRDQQSLWLSFDHEISIPSGAIKSLHFFSQTELRTNISIPSGAIKSLIKNGASQAAVEFQFLLVRLRADQLQLNILRIDISIPSGAIKSSTLVSITIAAKYISIPSGAIKRTESLPDLPLTDNYFNSFWCD